MKRANLRRAGTLLALAAALGHTGAALAHESPSEETIARVMQQTIPEAAGKRVLMLTVSYGPGQSSAAHLHPGPIFAYVLEGGVVSQLAGEEAKTYAQGQSWYEPPGSQHLVSKNASQSQSAKLLVFAITSDNEPVKKPLPQ